MSRLTTAIAELRENEHQWKAFSTASHCAVLAPPGSGKTKLLTTRMAYDLVSEAIPPPQGAACVTMTNEAAGELRRRLAALGVLPRPNVFVGTVHGFALSSIVAPYAQAAGRPDIVQSRLASQLEMDQAYDRAFIYVLGSAADPRWVKSTVDKVRRLADYSGSPLLGGPDIAALARRYEHELQEQGTYDFNDLMRHAVEMVRGHEWLRRLLIATYPHLYVDEYQDLPPTLDALVRALSFDQAVDATLFAVGDPDQAINGFMGTRPELLIELAKLSRVRRVDLEINYRCGEDIVQASLRALGETRNVRGLNEGGDIVIEAPSDGPEEQRKRAVALVRDALSEGIPHEQITVLAQANEERDLIVDALREEAIPVYARSDRDYGTTPVTMAIEALALYAAADPPPAEELADLLDLWQAVLRATIDHEAITELIEVLRTTSADLLAVEFVASLTRLGLEDLVANPGSSQDGRELERLRASLAPHGALKSISVQDLGDRARAKGRVMAATTHGIKGLEFDVVIVCDCEEGRMPHWGSIKGSDPAALQEDRRKFYVSLTRARRRVHIVWARWRISKRTGRRYDVELSRFARSLMPASAR
jgi:DNA helicase-2/ATP-dependent DNA helicase PcrA